MFELVLRRLLHLRAHVAREERVDVVGIAEQIRRRQYGPRRQLLGDVLRRNVADLEIVALHGDELGSLFEQRAAQVQLELEVPLDVLGKHAHHVRADVLVGKHRGEPQRRPVLPPRGH